MSKLLKYLITLLCIVVLAGVVYLFTIGKTKDANVNETTNVSGSSDDELDISVRTEKILADTKEIGRYTLDGDSIFGDKRFTLLKDYRTEIKDVKTGRENPFQPIN